VFLAGSTQEPEEGVALEVFRTLAPQCHGCAYPGSAPCRSLRYGRETARRLRAALATRTELGGREACGVRRAAGDPEPAVDASRPTAHASRILLVDVVGELGAWWAPLTLRLSRQALAIAAGRT